MFLCVIVGFFRVGRIACGEPPPILERIQAVGTTNSISMLAALSAEVESLRTKNSALYFQASDRLSAVLEPFATTNAARLEQLEGLCQHALVTECPTNPSAADLCIKSKLQIARRLERAFPPSLERARVLADFLGEVRTIMITNYKWLQVSMNVLPPIWPTNVERFSLRFSGMDPKTIKDPRARAAYEQAIDENQQHNCENILQTHTIPEANWALAELFVTYTQRVFAQDPRTMEQAASLAKEARLTAEEERLMRSSSQDPGPLWYHEHSPR